MRKAPAIAMPARSTATWMVFWPAKKAPSVSACTAAGVPEIVQARSSPNKAINAVPTGAGRSTMRPCDIQAAMAEPTAMAMANTAR